MGMRISPEAEGLWAMSKGRPRPVDVATLPYPGLATDYLPVLVALQCFSTGTSYATENVFSGRFRYIGELARMGARIRVEDHHLVIDGVERLSGAPVRAVDIRWRGFVVAVLGVTADGHLRRPPHQSARTSTLHGAIGGTQRADCASGRAFPQRGPAGRRPSGCRSGWCFEALPPACSPSRSTANTGIGR